MRRCVASAGRPLVDSVFGRTLASVNDLHLGLARQRQRQRQRRFSELGAQTDDGEARRTGSKGK